MRICLGTIHAKKQFIPLALLYLKAYLVEREGLPADDIALIEFPQDATPQAIADQILATSPDIVALSCYVWNIQTFRAVCAHLKAARAGLTIVLGGPEVGPIGDTVLAAHPSVDVVVKSEGEVTFGQLVRAARDGSPRAAIKGIWFREGDAIVDTGEAPILMDLNTLPSPHQPAYAIGERRIVSIETQRGCVFRCNFCFYNKDLSIRNRRFDLERVKREILFWLERDVIEIYLMDPIFNLKAERAKEICRFIAEHNRNRVVFHAEVWAEFIDDELARLMSAANIRFVEVGLQTTEESALAAVERRLRMAPFLDGIGYLKQYGIKFELQLIYGLPGETVASFRRSLDFAARLDPPYLAVFPLMVLPGTELWRKAASIGLRYDSEPPYFVQSHADMPATDINRGWQMVTALEVLGESKTVRLLCKEPNVTMSDVVDAWIDRQADPGQPAAFIADFCGERDLPVAFYAGFASREFGDSLPAEA
jgi:radical SAM superfamily enzyme YgiQ (UPF0313 family)